MIKPDVPRATDSLFDQVAEPESIMPAQVVSHPGQSTALEGERRLVAAVLEDAFLCFRKYAGASDLRGSRLFSQAEKWFMDQDTGAALTFEFICDAGGLDADQIRSRLRRWHHQAIETARFGSGERDSERHEPLSADRPAGFKKASGE